RHGQVSCAAPADRARRRVAGAREEDVPGAAGAIVESEIGSEIAVVVAWHQRVPRAAPGGADRGREARAGFEDRPDACRRTVDGDVGNTVAVEILARHGPVAGAAPADALRDCVR